MLFLDLSISLEIHIHSRSGRQRMTKTEIDKKKQKMNWNIQNQLENYHHTIISYTFSGLNQCFLSAKNAARSRA